jgi:hypothetical protein
MSTAELHALLHRLEALQRPGTDGNEKLALPWPFDKTVTLEIIGLDCGTILIGASMWGFMPQGFAAKMTALMTQLQQGPKGPTVTKKDMSTHITNVAAKWKELEPLLLQCTEKTYPNVIRTTKENLANAKKEPMDADDKKELEDNIKDMTKQVTVLLADVAIFKKKNPDFK